MRGLSILSALPLLLALFLSSAQAALLAPADLAAAIRDRVVQTPLLRGDFEQSKQVQGFAKPLISKGHFIVVRERGVLWITQTPFAAELKLTRREIVATQNGAVAFRLDAGKEPSVRVINGLMFALLNGDLAQLSEQFSILGSVDGKAWQLQLTPRQPALASLLKTVELAGESQVHSILILEANGDRTLIRFSAQTTEPARLNAEEARQFGPLE